MKLRTTVITLYVIAMSLCTSVHSNPRDYLERHDIHPIMTKMMGQHVEVRWMTPVILQRSLQEYIDQLDPGRLYLLQSEVDPYQNLSSEQLTSLLYDYKADNYRLFQELNSLAQRVILRAREYRQVLAAQMPELLQDSLEKGALTRGLPEDETVELPFARTEDELFQRHCDDFVRFISIQRLRVGDATLAKYEGRLVKLYDGRKSNAEREYLFLSEDGQRLDGKEREHYFVLHILKAMAGSLDAHSAFFDSAEAYDMRIRLEKGFQGIGVVLQESIEGVVITRLIDGGPAQRSGEILPNDRLVEVDGRSVVDDSFRAVLDLIRGDEGSSVVLGLKRLKKDDHGNETESFLRVTLRREKIVVSENRVDVDHRPVEGGIVGVIKLHSFYEGADGVSSEADVRRALKELHGIGHLQGLILDLRGNTGGFLVQSVKVAGLFITNGVIVVSKYGDGEERVFRDIDGYAYYDGPLVVLTSRASASAAEIVAQALQDYGAGVIVGDEQTYGKGSIQHQTVTNESSTSFFKVTVGRFYTVSGRSTQIRGVEADIVVPSSYHREPIGERFQDYALTTDRIHNLYVDDLADVDSSVRYWYKKYYLPSLQHRTAKWDPYLDELRAKSQARLAVNKEFQDFLKQSDEEYEALILAVSEERLDENTKDLQLEEGVLILQDMIDMRMTREGFVENGMLRGAKKGAAQGQ
ncbi:Uncharacterized protein SCG7086_AU_00070 [Chlamydiales bacterium SCGC AG-110-P3]|nr:Uncharacterized protein SCG7086_AU_00070 [Chlamydiales bacterium SCGC AG-110-P3]